MNSDCEFDHAQKQENSAAKIAVETAATENHAEAGKPAKDDNVVRVTRTSSIRNQIAYTMKRVQAGDTITISGLGLGISKAILIASVVRDRIGNVHMLNSFDEVADKRRPELKTTGIRITLST
jgi:DNA-binding protein